MGQREGVPEGFLLVVVDSVQDDISQLMCSLRSATLGRITLQREVLYFLSCSSVLLC